MPVSHAFTNTKADGNDATVTRPSDWNAGHVVIVDLATEVTGILPSANMQFNPYTTTYAGAV